jgi:hypothetical protein
MNGEDKEYPRVNFYMHKSDYQLTDEAKYELSVNFDGKELGYDYESRSDVLRDRNQNEKLFGLVGVEDLVTWSNRIVENRREGIEKMQSNLRNLAKLEKERTALKAKIDAYNEKISYAISDTMRIK